MKIVEQPDFGEVALLEIDEFYDSRGSFGVTWEAEAISSLVGSGVAFVQTNTVRSHYAVARGLHYHVAGKQGKLVWCLLGRHWSVAVDVRKNSATAGKWFGATLTQMNHRALWVPPGFAHGVVCLSPGGVLQYSSTTKFDRENERSLALDSDVNVNWPIPVKDMLCVERDLAVKSLEDFWGSYA